MQLQRRNGWSFLLNSERSLWYDGRCGWFKNFEFSNWPVTFESNGIGIVQFELELDLEALIALPCVQW